jgi:hypothetical protein
MLMDYWSSGPRYGTTTEEPKQSGWLGDNGAELDISIISAMLQPTQGGTNSGSSLNDVVSFPMVVYNTLCATQTVCVLLPKYALFTYVDTIELQGVYINFVKYEFKCY